MGSALELALAVTDIIQTTCDSRRAAELIEAWGENRYRAGVESAADHVQKMLELGPGRIKAAHQLRTLAQKGQDVSDG